MNRLFLLTSALSVLAITAHADGLTQVFDDPPVMEPARSDWSGPYIGLSYGTTKSTRTRVEEGYDYHEATCTRGTGSNAHENNKCKLNNDLFDALGAPLVVNPWDVAPYKLNDGALTDQLAKYDAGYKGLWLGDDVDGVHSWRLGEVVPTTEQVTALNSDGSRDAVLSVLHYFQADQTIAERVSESGFGAFAGYRHDFGRLVGGVEIGVAPSDLKSAEVQLGLDLGRVLVYGVAGIGKFEDDSGTLYGAGADFRVSDRVVIGGKYVTGDFAGNDVDSASVRVALTF